MIYKYKKADPYEEIKQVLSLILVLGFLLYLIVVH